MIAVSSELKSPDGFVGVVLVGGIPVWRTQPLHRADLAKGVAEDHLRLAIRKLLDDFSI